MLRGDLSLFKRVEISIQTHIECGINVGERICFFFTNPLVYYVLVKNIMYDQKVGLV